MLSYFAKPLFISLAFIPLLGCAQAPAKQSQAQQICTITNQQRELLLNLDYMNFDQSLPNGGWRKYDQCPSIARELLDAYTVKYEKTLTEDQRHVLVWHSGQMSAKLGDYPDAIHKMGQTFRTNDLFLWNPYAKATIAFLKKDKASLISERNKLARGLSPWGRLNLRKVDAFIRCFDFSYIDAYSGSCQPAETNGQRIQSLAVPFDWKKELLQDFMGIREFLSTKKVILVGEIHGTKTVPQLFGNLVASIADPNKKTLVILEINQNSQASIDEFVKTGDESALRKDTFFSRQYQDGRSSKAMVQLLKKLVKLPNTKILCMDPMDGIKTMSGQERDTAMANFINTHRVSYDHTLVLTGNVHSSVIIGTPWDKIFQPMGYELKNMAKDLNEGELFSIRLRHEKVDSWNCFGAEPSSCYASYGKKKPTDYSQAVKYPSYFIWEGQLVDGHDASIFVRRAEISLPYIK